MIPSIVVPLISPLVVPTVVDAPNGVDSANQLTGASSSQDSNDPFSSASIVNLSTQAQLLAAAVLQNDAMLAEQENILQLAETRTQLNQEINATQYAALTTNEATIATTALLSTLADVVFSEAVAATVASTASVETVTATPSFAQTPSFAAMDDLLNTASVIAPPVSEATPPVAVAVNNAATIALPPFVANPGISVTDPAVAAAIAAYRLGDGLFAVTVHDGEEKVEENPSEDVADVAPVTAVEPSRLDLQDGVHDDAAGGNAWNGTRVRSVQRKFTRR